MQNSIPELRQSLIISKKPDNLSEQLKTGSNYHRLKYFFVEECSGFFILFRSWTINKKVKKRV